VGFELTRPLFVGAGALALVIIVATWLRIPPPLPVRRARIALGVRVAIVTLLTAALAGLGIQTTPSSQSLIVAADLSASVQSALDREAATVRSVLAMRRGEDRAGVLSFGRDPQVEVNVGSAPQFGEFQSQPNPHYTDIAAALRLAGSILPVDRRRHIVLVSDGRANLGDAVGEARLLRAWAGFVNGVEDWLPIIGEIESVPGLFVGSFPWMGFTAGPLMGRVLADLVLERPSERDLAPFSPTSF